MKTQVVLLVLLLMGISPIVKAQKFEVPNGYEFNNKGDFEKYQPEVLKAIDWFERMPWNEERFKRMDMANFIMDWIEGCPYVTVETSDGINQLGNGDNDLLIMYFAGYARYVLTTHMLGISKKDARMAGIRALLNKYEKDKAFIKDKKVEKLVKLDQQGGLQAWLSEELDD